MEEEQVNKLIEKVEKEKALYDKRHPFYFTKIKRDQIWQRIGKEIGINENKCKHRWKLLRERYVKEKKKKEQRSGMGSDIQNEWKFFRSMTFLNSSIEPRCSTVDNEFEEADFSTIKLCVDSSSSCEELSLDPLTPRNSTPQSLSVKSVKPNLNKVSSSNLVSEDNATTADESFLRTVAHLMRDLPIEAKDQFQLEMFKKLYELRAKYRK